VIRWTNGWVQVTAIGLFWLGLLIVLVQYLALVTWERRRANEFFPFSSQLPERVDDSHGHRLTSSLVHGQLKRLYSRALKRDPGTAVFMLRDVYEAYSREAENDEKRLDNESAASVLHHAAEHKMKKLESDMASLVYLGWALPSLGFIGTVLYLGTALLTAGDIVTPVSELQRDAIQTVSIYLGRAFDKTFVALVLSLVVMLFIYYVRWAQEAVVLEFQHKIARGVVRRLREKGEAP
jgi:biopolymer transport protein ExbB/TolQ